MTKPTVTSSGETLTAAQSRTIESLRKAFRDCEAAGVDIYGVDNTVLAIRKGVLNGTPITEIDKDKQSLIETVVAGGAYIDSGGW